MKVDFLNRIVKHIDNAGESGNHGEQNCTDKSLGI